MKKSARYILPLILIIFLSGCSMFRSQEAGSLFLFEYQGKMYEIAGHTNEMGESANFLTHREGKKVMFRAIDHNRAGIIDQVLSGSIGVLDANKIYQAGIQIAMEEDLFKNIKRNRTYESRYGDYQLVVETYLKRNNEYHNRFLVFTLNWDLKGIYWDDDSDGLIDRSESGEVNLETARDLYSIILNEAGEDDQLIETENGQMIIGKDLNKNSNSDIAFRIKN